MLFRSDYLNACVVSSHVLCKNCCVGVGIVTADDYDSGKAVLLGNFGNNLELLFSLKFGSAGTDDIETACISVSIDESIIKLYIVIF